MDNRKVTPRKLIMVDSFEEDKGAIVLDEGSGKSMDDLYNIIDKWYDDFEKSEYFNQLTEFQKQKSYFIISNFAQMLLEYEGLMPKDWEIADVRGCCLIFFPRKVSAENQTFAAIAPVLSSFFTFLNHNKLLPDALKMAKAVRDVTNEIVRNAQDRSKWGMSKTMLSEYITGVKGSGHEDELKDVDPNDPFVHIELGLERMKKDIPFGDFRETGQPSAIKTEKKKSSKEKRKKQKAARKKNLKKKK